SRAVAKKFPWGDTARGPPAAASLSHFGTSRGFCRGTAAGFSTGSRPTGSPRQPSTAARTCSQPPSGAGSVAASRRSSQTRRPVPPRPLPQPLERTRRAGQDRLVVEPPLQVVGHLLGGGVPLLRRLGHRLGDDRVQLRRDHGVAPPRRRGVLRRDPPEHLLAV